MVLHQKQDVNKILVSKLENFIYLTTKFDDRDHTNIYHKEEVPVQQPFLHKHTDLVHANFLPGSLMAGALECFTIHISPIK